MSTSRYTGAQDEAHEAIIRVMRAQEATEKRRKRRTTTITVAAIAGSAVLGLVAVAGAHCTRPQGQQPGTNACASHPVFVWLGNWGRTAGGVASSAAQRVSSFGTIARAGFGSIGSGHIGS